MAIEQRSEPSSSPAFNAHSKRCTYRDVAFRIVGTEVAPQQLGPIAFEILLFAELGYIHAREHAAEVCVDLVVTPGRATAHALVAIAGLK